MVLFARMHRPSARRERGADPFGTGQRLLLRLGHVAIAAFTAAGVTSACRLPLAPTLGAITAFSTVPWPHIGQLTKPRARWSS